MAPRRPINATATRSPHRSPITISFAWLADRAAAREAASLRPTGFQDPPSFAIACRRSATLPLRQGGSPAENFLLWIGPGWGIGSGAYADGNSSREQTFYTVRWFSTLLREARITLYSFSVGEMEAHAEPYLDDLHGVRSAREANFMHLYRKVLAVESGGRVLDKSDDLVPQIQSCVNEAVPFTHSLLTHHTPIIPMSITI